MRDTSPKPEPSPPRGSDLPATLEGLRGEIDALDRQIVELLARRSVKVQEVVAIKTAQHLPVYHPAREEDLISQRRDQAAQAGLDPDHVEELYRSILRQSRLRQTIQVSRVPLRPGARILIVGGGGKMGSYFRRWFESTGYEVRVLGIDDWPRVAAICADADAALVSVPIERTVDVIRQVGPHLRSDCVLADITSVKVPPVETMLSVHSGPVVGLHPLFGPNTVTMDKQLVLACPGRSPDECQWLLDQLTAWGNIVVPIAPQEHDEVMAVVQALRHFAAFAFGDFLCRRGVNLQRTLELSSPIYRLELGMIGRLFAQDPELYAEIIFATRERRELVQTFINALARYRDLLAADDKAAFCDEFRRIAEWFGPFCGQALRESNYLIEKLVERF